jgi:subtilisin family serine protease
VAKNAALVGVKVLDSNGSGSNSDVIAGIDYVVEQKKANPSTPMIINMSLGGFHANSLNEVVDRAVDAGVVTVVAAGNNGRNACLFSPASASKAITVGASTISNWFDRDRRAEYSNFGQCVDIFAPGSGIRSAFARDDEDVAELSGTSMASPHVAGAAALVLQKNPTMSPDQVKQALVDGATKGKLMRIFNRWTPNLILNTANI